jgi:biopolymer transport protein TolR
MAEINVTPLVDVMLVLLIIFMVTAPMMREGISVDLPSEKGKPIPQQEKLQIVVSVSKDGSVYINEEKVDLQDLAATIKESAAKTPNQEVYLRADKNVSYGTVVKIMANLRSSGIQNLGMITSPAQEAPTE